MLPIVGGLSKVAKSIQYSSSRKVTACHIRQFVTSLLSCTHWAQGVFSHTLPSVPSASSLKTEIFVFFLFACCLPLKIFAYLLAKTKVRGFDRCRLVFVGRKLFGNFTISRHDNQQNRSQHHSFCLHKPETKYFASSWNRKYYFLAAWHHLMTIERKINDWMFMSGHSQQI